MTAFFPGPGTAWAAPVPEGPPRRAAFLDRDGVINVDHGYTSRIADFQFVPGVLDGCAALHAAGYALVVVTNQSGIGRGLYDIDAFLALTTWMRERLAAAGAPLAGVYYCPHHPVDAAGPWRMACACRKPAPGMLLKALDELRLDAGASVMFGDRASDLQAARAAGIRRNVLLAHNGVKRPPSGPGAADFDAEAHPDFRFTTLSEALADPGLREALLQEP